MDWHYQLIVHDTHPNAWIGLHEVYYEDNRVVGWTENAVTFVCDEEEGTTRRGE